MSSLEAQFLLMIKAYKLPLPIKEFKFCPTRKWKCDFCWPEQKIIIELEGGIYTRGRHVRPKGYLNDCEKYNEAQLLGFRVFRLVTDHLKNGYAITLLHSLFHTT